MAFVLRREDRSIKKGIRRIAGEQVKMAIASIDVPSDPGKSVHDVRLRCKKLRGLVRLVRPVFPGYGLENAAFRDIARTLSGPRDANVLQNTLEKLAKVCDDPDECAALDEMRRSSSSLLGAAPNESEIEKRLVKCRGPLAEVQNRVHSWNFQEKGWGAISDGLSATYLQARSAGERARIDPSADNYHELRKQLKFHWFHTQLLRRISPDMMRVRSNSARQATAFLGEHHDLFVLETRIKARCKTVGEDLDVVTVHALAHRRRQILETEAWPLVDSLLEVPPNAFIDHWHKLWKAWR